MKDTAVKDQKWELIGSETLGMGSQSLTIYKRVFGTGEIDLLYARNDSGLLVRFYNKAFDAVNDQRTVGEICYGYDTLVHGRDKEQELFNLMLSRDERERVSWSEKFERVCEHKPLSCEEMNHAAQVYLDNEECGADCDGIKAEDFDPLKTSFCTAATWFQTLVAQ